MESSADQLDQAVGAQADDLEAVLGHTFSDRELLVQALTHSSLACEQTPRGEIPEQAAHPDNERLEFLGDAVVGLIAGESMYRRFPDLREGDLTRLRGLLVSRKHLAEVGLRLRLGKHLLLGRGEERSGGRAKPALLANAMEAVIGSVYMDAGLEAARRIVERHVIEPEAATLRQQLQGGGGAGDFKSALQEHLQARKQGQPEYRTTAEAGPDHRKQFFVEVRVAGRTFAEGSGPTRKLAEQDAARHAMERLTSGGDSD